MIGYNNQGIKLLPYNAPIPLYKNKHYTKPEVDRAWPAYLIRSGPFYTRLVFSNENAGALTPQNYN